jgi:para-nitrobenzyl esterase
VKPSPWEGALDATRYGATAQRRPFGDNPTIPEPSIPGESTLNVNVFTPAPGDPPAKLPVFVWIHGGGYFAGSPASPWYDGRAFNRDGVVTVTLSYRLGFDGFGWIDGAPLNRGILDQIAALEWVQENIAQFGGDPGRVTIGGQSAGGGSVLTLLATPRANGLFRAAISESGALSRLRPEVARDVSARLAAAAGIDGIDLDSWRRLSEDTILDHERVLNFSNMFMPGASPGELVSRVVDAREDVLGLAFVPVVDGDLVLDFEAVLNSGIHRGTPLLLGTTYHEFVIPTPNDEPTAIEAALANAGASADTVHQFRAKVQQLGSGYARGQLVSQASFRLPAVHIAGERTRAGSGDRTWLYDFRYPSPLTGAAGHCMELPFVWDVLDAEGVDKVVGADPPQQLAVEMHRDWVRFITSGWCPWATVADQPAGAELYDDDVRFDPDAYRLERELSQGKRSDA